MWRAEMPQPREEEKPPKETEERQLKRWEESQDPQRPRS